MAIPESIEFNGKQYVLLGKRKYYFAVEPDKRTKHGRRLKGLHVAVWEAHRGQKVPKGHVVHHKDGNTFNNDPSNLECLSYGEHGKLNEYCRSDAQLKHLAKIRCKASEWHKSEIGRDWHREHWRNSIGKHFIEHTKICEICGEEFVAKTKRARFCGRNCIAKNWRKGSKERRLQPKEQ